MVVGVARGDSPGRARQVRTALFPLLWLAWVSACCALAVTVALFDRVAPAQVTRLWAGSLLACWLVAFVWWARPRLAKGRLLIAPYRPVWLAAVTAPLALAAVVLVAASYLSDSVHGYIFSHLYYRNLLLAGVWQVGLLPPLVFGYALVWGAREFLAGVGSGSRPPDAVLAALSRSRSLHPVAILALGFLLGTVSLSMINVNFWRYWATADGWAVTGHYPSTFTDILHVEKGGVSRYFLSFPLLPSLLTVSFGLFGHNVLGSYVPLILGSALLPMAVLLATREATRDPLVSFLFACLAASFPLLRSYTVDVGEADGWLMTAVILAAFFRLRSDRPGANRWVQGAAGLVAGVAALARAEGVLYMGAMYLAALRGGWRDKGFWLSVFTFALVVAGFSAVSWREFGMIWPGNHSGTLGLSNFGETLAVVRQGRLFGMYSLALGISQETLAVLLVGTLALVLYATVRMVRKDFSLVYMPVAALGNVMMVFFVGPIPAEAGKFHDFFRHISYGFPLLAVTLAYGLTDLCRRLGGRRGQYLRAALSVALAGVVVVQILLLAGPVTPGHPTGSPITTSDVHLSAAQLLVDPYPLPVMAFRLSESRYVPDAEPYMATYPDNVNARYAGADVRLAGNAVEYYRAALAIFLGFLGLSIPSAALARSSGTWRPS